MGHLATLSPTPSIEEMFDCPKESQHFIKGFKHEVIAVQDSELYNISEAQSADDIAGKWEDRMPPHLCFAQQKNTEALPVSACP
jgi:hypothetical protein